MIQFGMPLFTWGGSLRGALATRPGPVRPLQLDWRAARIERGYLGWTPNAAGMDLPDPGVQSQLLCTIPWTGDAWLWHATPDDRPLYLPQGQVIGNTVTIGALLPAVAGADALDRAVMDQRLRLLDCLLRQADQLADRLPFAGPASAARPRLQPI